MPADDFLAVPFPKTPLYVGRRLWRVFDIVAPSLKLDPYLGYLPAKKTYPISLKPEYQVGLESTCSHLYPLPSPPSSPPRPSKLSINDVMAMLRDAYEGTEFDMTKGLAAGAFGNPLR